MSEAFSEAARPDQPLAAILTPLSPIPGSLSKNRERGWTIVSSSYWRSVCLRYTLSTWLSVNDSIAFLRRAPLTSFADTDNSSSTSLSYIFIARDRSEGVFTELKIRIAPVRSPV
ncbi:MAG: hypothetical protein J5950_09360 [Clostridia bacterium]|nr:hypothetical protein [Clostridia bacterium]